MTYSEPVGPPMEEGSPTAFPRLVPEFEFRSQSTALVVVDMQNRGTKPDMYRGLARILRDSYPECAEYYSRRLKLVIPNIEIILDGFRAKRLRVIYLTVGPQLSSGADFVSPFYRGYEEIFVQSGTHGLFPVGSSEHAIIDELAPREDELIINKTSSSPFNSTGIDVTLRHFGIDTLVCTGVVTDACVLTTARDAADRGYQVAVVEDACAALDEEMHRVALRSFATFAGTVLMTDELIGFL
jgi:nicotinamidase-related amidase